MFGSEVRSILWRLVYFVEISSFVALKTVKVIWTLKVVLKAQNLNEFLGKFNVWFRSLSLVHFCGDQLILSHLNRC